MLCANLILIASSMEPPFLNNPTIYKRNIFSDFLKHIGNTTGCPIFSAVAQYRQAVSFKICTFMVDIFVQFPLSCSVGLRNSK